MLCMTLPRSQAFFQRPGKKIFGWRRKFIACNMLEDVNVYVENIRKNTHQVHQPPKEHIQKMQMIEITNLG